MKRLTRFVARLYPKAWRDRYAVEFEALLEDVQQGWLPLFDVVRGAVHMQLNTWNKRRILGAGGIVGAFVGLGGWIAVPKQFASEGRHPNCPKRREYFGCRPIGKRSFE
jgi:hypothetical protein